MDSYRGFEDEPAFSESTNEEDVAPERPPEIGVDERRMHVRAYNYWVSLLHGRPYPSINDIDPHTIEDFGVHSVLLDFSSNAADPEIAFLGRTLREECALDQTIRNISQVPTRSLLSRLTDHYMQIIANRAPIGFEAEFVSQRGHNTLYRGILMPLSSNGEAIDYIYGVINWKELADSDTAHLLEDEIDRAIAAAPEVTEMPVWADGPNAEIEEPDPVRESAPEPAAEKPDNLELWPEPTQEAVNEEALPELTAEATLDDRLTVARAGADRANASEQRSRSALYLALGLAYDFAVAAESDPDGYQRLLDEAGLKVQERAPMTPVAKLVFGAGCAKARLTEFAAALSWAKREQLPAGALAERIAEHDGGLKGIVQAERKARRPQAAPDRWQQVREALRQAPALAELDPALAPEGGDFVLLIARREPDRLAIVAPVADERLVEQAIRKSLPRKRRAA
ncbi:MAG: PAS domain-containing protein [Sphingosinicella sp.]